jgi:hypothetical protein
MILIMTNHSYLRAERHKTPVPHIWQVCIVSNFCAIFHLMCNLDIILLESLRKDACVVLQIHTINCHKPLSGSKLKDAGS